MQQCNQAKAGKQHASVRSCAQHIFETPCEELTPGLSKLFHKPTWLNLMLPMLQPPAPGPYHLLLLPPPPHPPPCCPPHLAAMSYAPIAMPTGSQDTITLLRANTLLVSLKPSTPARVYVGRQNTAYVGGWARRLQRGGWIGEGGLDACQHQCVQSCEQRTVFRANE